MARIRTIKPKFFTSPDTAKLSYQARILFIAMWCWADDYGKGETNLNGLLGLAFPESDDLERKDVQRLCSEVQNACDVEFYIVEERAYYAIPSWDKHQKTQRQAKSDIPDPDDPRSSPDPRFYADAGVTRKSEEVQSRHNEAPPLEEEGEREEEREDTSSSDVASDDHDGGDEDSFPDHIIELCDHLAEHIKRNGNKVGTVGKRWHQAMDRLNRTDGYTADQIRQVIDWSQQDEFWQGNILSAPKLREKFDQLKTRMLNERNRPAKTGPQTASERRLEAGAERLQRKLGDRLAEPMEGRLIE